MSSSSLDRSKEDYGKVNDEGHYQQDEVNPAKGVPGFWKGNERRKENDEVGEEEERPFVEHGHEACRCVFHRLNGQEPACDRQIDVLGEEQLAKEELGHEDNDPGEHKPSCAEPCRN